MKSLRNYWFLVFWKLHFDKSRSIENIMFSSGWKSVFFFLLLFICSSHHRTRWKINLVRTYLKFLLNRCDLQSIRLRPRQIFSHRLQGLYYTRIQRFHSATRVFPSHRINSWPAAARRTFESCTHDATWTHRRIKRSQDCM